MTNDSIKHFISVPFHLVTNDQAKQAVQSFKDSLKKIKEENIKTLVFKILLQFHTTAHSTKGLSPAELLMKKL